MTDGQTISQEDFGLAAYLSRLVSSALGKRDEYELSPVGLMYAAVGGSVCHDAEQLKLTVEGLADLTRKLDFLAEHFDAWFDQAFTERLKANLMATLGITEDEAKEVASSATTGALAKDLAELQQLGSDIDADEAEEPVQVTETAAEVAEKTASSEPLTGAEELEPVKVKVPRRKKAKRAARK